jgi:hypothetical protein
VMNSFDTGRIRASRRLHNMADVAAPVEASFAARTYAIARSWTSATHLYETRVSLSRSTTTASSVDLVVALTSVGSFEVSQRPFVRGVQPVQRLGRL